MSNVALMGFRNSSAFAQRFMDHRLHHMKAFRQAFIDDACIFSKTKKDHIEHLRQLFTTCQKIGLAINPKKCFLGYPSIKLLGCTVNGSGVSIPDERVEAIKKIKMPNTLGHLFTYGLVYFLVSSG